jgi:predicted nucleotide-binding protein
MTKSEAIQILKQQSAKIQHLTQLLPGNQEFKLWRDMVSNVIKAALDPDDRMTFYRAVPLRTDFSWASANKPAQDRAQDRLQYVEDLDNYETALKSIIEKYEVLGFEDKPAAGIQAAAPKAFIAHGGDSAALHKLHSFLEALGVEPLIVEIQPSEGRLTEMQVDEHMKQADCAIILATYGYVEDVKTGKKHPRLNVVDELGRCRKMFPHRTILLLEKGVDLPSNVSGIVYEHFTNQNMEKAFMKVAKELRAFDLIRPAKPSGQQNVQGI